MKKYPIILILILIFLLGACSHSPQTDLPESAESEHKDISIGVLVPVITEDYWKTDIQGMQEQANELNINLIVQSSQTNPEFQAKQMENMIEQKVDAIILSAVDVYSIMDTVKKCNHAGIPVIYNSRILTNTEDARFTYGVGYDVSSLALMGTEWLAEYTKENNIRLNVLELYGADTDSHTLLCKQGFAKGYDRYPMTFSSVIGVDGSWEAEQIYQQTYKALTENPEVNCIILLSDAQLPSVQYALTELNRYEKNGHENHVIIAAMGGEAASLNALNDGYVDVLMATPIYDTAKLSVSYAYDIIMGKEVDGQEHILSGFIVDKENFNVAAYNAFGYLGKK